MKYMFLDVTIIISALVLILILFQGIDFIKVFGIILIIIIVLPLVFFFVLKNTSKKYKWKIITTNIITSLLIIFSLFYLLFVEIFFFALKSDFLFPFSKEPKLPKLSEYSKEIESLKSKHGVYKMRHFPDKIPDNASNYYFQIEDAFDGNNTDYVKFDSNKKYINDVLKKYKKDCVVFMTSEDLYKSGIKIYINELGSSDNICLLHKKQNNEVYTSGFVTKKPNTIIFFYANF